MPMPLRSRSFSITRPAPLIQRSRSTNNVINHHNNSPRITAKGEPVSPTSKHLASSVLTKGSTIPHLPNCKCASCKEQLEIQLAHDAIIEEVAKKLKSPAFEAFLNQRVSLTTDQLDKMELARLHANVDKLPPRYPAQVIYYIQYIHSTTKIMLILNIFKFYPLFE